MELQKMRKLMASLFTAALLILAVLVPGFAETDAEAELRAANAEVAACEQALADAKAADTASLEAHRQGTYGFFRQSGSEKALQVLDNAKYKNLIAYGTGGDATSLENMEKALDLIERINEFRAKEGLPEQLVTDSMMAMAEADADAFYDLKTAPKQFTVDNHKIAENLGTFATADAAANAWYAEKKVADEHPDYMDYSSPNWSKVGHWYNMSQKRYVVTGAAVNTRLGNKFAQTYYSTANGETTYTVEQYRARLKAYEDSVADKQQAVKDAQQALDAAKVRQQTAQRIVDAEQNHTA